MLNPSSKLDIRISQSPYMSMYIVLLVCALIQISISISAQGNCTYTIYECASTSTSSSTYKQSMADKCLSCAKQYQNYSPPAALIKCDKCQPPYIINFIQELTYNSGNKYKNNYKYKDIPTQLQYCFTNFTTPCILCTDKYPLNLCVPSYHKYSQSQHTYQTILTLALNDAYSWNSVNYTPQTILSNAFQLVYGIDGHRFPTANYNITSSNNLNYVYVTIYNLTQTVARHYQYRNYSINGTQYQIKIRKRGSLLFYPSQTYMPKSYKVDFSFKSSINGFQTDRQLSRSYDGSEYINFYFNMTNVTSLLLSNSSNLMNMQDDINSTNSNTSTETGTPIVQFGQGQNKNDGQMMNTSTPTDTDTANSFKNQTSTTTSNLVSNNYGIQHQFSNQQIKAKQAIQIGLVTLCSVGLIGAGTSNWLTFSLSNTHSFKQLGMYDPPNQSRRLLLTQSQAKTIPTITNSHLKNMIQSLANLTLIYNPLILAYPQTEVAHQNKVFPSFTKSLVFTNFTILSSVFILSLFLLYMNAYTKVKTHYDHSHIFKTLSQRNMVKRVVYMTLRGVYPILTYSAIVFMHNIVQYFLSKGLSNMEINDFWNIAYVVENCIFCGLMFGMPLFGLYCFDRKDKHNIYIYSRIFGEEHTSLIQQEQYKYEQNGKDINDENIQRKQSKQSKIQSSQCSIYKHMALRNKQLQQIKRSALKSEQMEIKQKCMVQQIPAHQSKISDSIKHKQTHKTSMCDMVTTTNRFLQKGNVRQYKSSRKPQVFFIFEYIYTWIFIAVNIFMNQHVSAENMVLVIMSGLYLILMCYFGFTVCVSRTYAIVRIIQLGLIFGYFICRFFWGQSDIAVTMALYFMYCIGVWTIVHVLFSMISMLYWEKKGIGIYAFFASKIIPSAQQKQIDNYNKSTTKLDELLKSERAHPTKSYKQLTEIQQLELIENQDKIYEENIKQMEEENKLRENSPSLQGNKQQKID